MFMWDVGAFKEAVRIQQALFFRSLDPGIILILQGSAHDEKKEKKGKWGEKKKQPEADLFSHQIKNNPDLFRF